MTTPDTNRPAQARKQPRQQRSIALVRALKDACLRIISEEGEAALTIARLSDISGVAITSIYEYFPNVDAIIADIFEDHLRAAVNRSNAGIAQLPESAGLRGAVAVVVRQSLGMRTQLAELYPAFYQRHIDYFETVRRLGEETDPNSAFQRMRRIFDRYEGELRGGDRDKMFFLLVRTLQFVTRAIVLEHEAYLREPDTAAMLTDMLYGLLSGDAGASAAIPATPAETPATPAAIPATPRPES